MLENYNLNPYFDDYNDDKNFHRMLFKPSFAVQARELTQIQTILQKQVERFGNHVFKNGSVVTGGQFFYQDAISLKIDNEYSSFPVNVSNFENTTILSLDGTKRGEVVKVYDNDLGTDDPKTFLVKQIFGEPFVSGETIKTSEESPYFATISVDGIGSSKIFSVNEGIFYYEGFFIRTPPQTIAVSKYTNIDVASRIGFDVVESIVTSSADTSLLDPALGSSNYQAPGSDRVRIQLVLNIRSLESTDDEKFIELIRIENSEITREYKYPLYSVLEETLARRTYDESGNYTVRPFKISLETNSANSAQTDIILSPGKGYVHGYEFVRNSSTIITVDKPRESVSIQNKRVTAEYGNFLYTNSHLGSFPINSLGILDIHCVPKESINVDSTSTISNTKIGTARIKTLEYDSSANIANSQTYEYRTYLFDVNVDQNITGNVVSISGSNVVIGTAGDEYSNVDQAYQGARLSILTGPGAGEPTKSIISYDGTTKIVTLNQPFIVTPTTSSVFSIDFGINDAESFIITSGTNIITAANIDERSKDSSKPFADVFLTDSALESTIFVLGEENITQNTISDMSFSYKRSYSNQVFSSNESPSLGIGVGESLSSGLSLSSRSENYLITVTNPGLSSYSIGEIISADKFTVDTITRKITVVGGSNMTADIIVVINITNPTRKNKSYISSNTTIQTVGGVDVFSNNAVVTYGSQGQTHIDASFVNKVPNQIQSLFVSDVYNVVSVKDFRGLSITNENLLSATDVTSKFIFDNGQRDSYYDHSTLTLKPNVRPPVGPLVIFYNRFASAGAGFFTVDSYSQIEYGNIPVYVSPTNNNTFKLRDCLDFRPVRSDATAGSGSTFVFDIESSTTGPKIVKNGSDIILDYSFYVPRIDKVVLDKNQTFEIVKGIAEINPAAPRDTDTGMTLYVLRNGAFVSNTSQIQVEYVNNKRYTMRDIGTLEKRIENLEYYTSLSLLEQDTISKQDLTIIDTQNLPRFKNGILVDSFSGSGIADVTDPDYIASIDPVNRELRPSFNISSYSLTFDAANSTNYLQSGPFITSSAANITLIDQPKASRFINVNPFNVINFLGKITLNPSSDIWVDIYAKPDVLVNLTGDRDAWELLFDSANELLAAQSEWGSWQTTWTGNPRTRTFDIQNNRAGNNWENLNAGVGGRNDVVRHTVNTVDQRQSRSGIITQVVPQSISQSIGERVVDVSVIPYMRSTNVLFIGTDFKPSVTVYPFFDGVSIENNVGNRVNKFFLANNNIELKKTLNDPEFVTIRDESTVIGEAIVVHHSNNIVYVTNVNPSLPFTNANTTLTIQGQTTGSTYTVTGYEHNGANASSGGASTITLRQDADGAKNIGSFNSSPIFIAQGTGSGQVRTISSYDPNTRIATVTPAWDTIPDTTSFYSIGRMKTDESGSVVGIYTIPEETFRIGEKLFRLVDNSSGDIGSSSTNGDASFFAQGLLQTVEETIVSTTVPQIQRVSVTDDRVVSVSTTTNRGVIWTDPLAQTFLVSPVQFPQGIFLSKIRVCFKSKDDVIPITLQVRPSVNGYPSSSVIYPFGTVSLTPDKVKVADVPNLEDDSTYTEFIFDAPLYMQPGEHSFVLLANSNKYEMFIAEIGKEDIVSNRQISEQPYGGSLFLSQNGSTWTADQNSDMMFRMFRYQFSANPVNAQFLLNFPETTPTPYDLTHLITSDVSVANTVLGYQFNSETLSAGYVGYKPINPLTDYDMNDGSGTRILNPTTGENTFILNALMQTNDERVSPFIDISRMGFLAVHNRINNLELSNNEIVITNGGSGYANSTDVTVTISGGGGSGALAEANVVGGVIDAIYIVDAGSDYTQTPSITITPGSGGGTGAEAVIVGETSKRGGPATARYISRRVTLNDGFDSGDIRVYLTAYKPKESQIYVYVKLLSISDSDTFENKEWQLLTQLGNANFVSTNSNDYRELTFAPGLNGVTDNTISYTSNGIVYPSFRTFAVKIVMAGTNTADVPKIRDFRAIALPAGG